MRYRRANTAGGTYFFTVNLADRKKRLLVEHAELLRRVMQEVKARHPFRIEALVLLPDHLHALWTLPEGDADFAVRWMLVKAGFSRALPKGERASASRMGKRERGVWQRRYWEHQIRDEADFARHAGYIHFNPVKHGYATRPIDWPYSSVHRYVRAGRLPASWGGGEAHDRPFGE